MYLNNERNDLQMADILQMDITQIASLGLKFAGDSETPIFAECTGSIAVETETRTISKVCAGATLKELTKPTKMTITINAYVPLEMQRRVYGLKHDATLNAGVYSYGKGSKGEEFSITAELVDEWQEESKLIAFLKASSANAFTFTVDASEDELSQLEIVATAYEDDLGYWYHESLESELEAPLTKETWLNALTSEELKKPTP